MPFGGPPYGNGILLCTPVYAPDPGHEDKDTHTGGYFAVVHDKWKGVVTSQDSLARALKRYPGARTFTAFTWSRFDDLWTLDCTEYHNHEADTPAAPKAETPATPKQRTPTTPKKPGLSDAQRRRNEDYNNFLVAENARIEAEDKVRLDLAYLAATKPPFVALSPRRARLQFERVLGPGAGQPPFQHAPDLPIPIAANDTPPSPTIPASIADSPGSPADLAGSMDGNSHLKRTHRQDAAITGTPPPEYSDFDPGPSTPHIESLKREPRLYAVSGHSRVFRNKDRAVAALQQTPGAELFWSRDPKEVWRFISETHVGLE